jgi:hypothetical protein
MHKDTSTTGSTRCECIAQVDSRSRLSKVKSLRVQPVHAVIQTSTSLSLCIYNHLISLNHKLKINKYTANIKAQEPTLGVTRNKPTQRASSNMSKHGGYPQKKEKKR